MKTFWTVFLSINESFSADYYSTQMNTEVVVCAWYMAVHVASVYYIVYA